MSYSAYKLIHIAALVFWLGPAIGAYWLVIRLKNDTDNNTHVIEKIYEEVLCVEHFSFITLLISGFGLWKKLGLGLFDLHWLNVKLIFVAIIIVVEIFDIIFSHFYFRSLIRKNLSPNSKYWIRFFKIRKIFYLISIPTLIFLVSGIFYFAIFRPF